MAKLTMLLAVVLLLAGCGGMPKPQIEAAQPRDDATLVRVTIVPTNYDGAWNSENVRFRAHQIWLDRSGVPTDQATIIDQPFGAAQGTARGTIRMKDAQGKSTRWVRLAFEIVSGENPQRENVSAGTTVEWKLPKDLSEKDIIFVAVLSRKSNNSYAIDALYAMEPITGYIEQVLPSNRES